MNTQVVEKINEIKIHPISQEAPTLTLLQQLQTRMRDLEEVSERKIFLLNELSSTMSRKTKVV